MATRKPKVEKAVPVNGTKPKSPRSIAALREKFESVEHLAKIHHAVAADTLEGAITTSQGNTVLRATAQTLRGAELQARFAQPNHKRTSFLEKLIAERGEER